MTGQAPLAFRLLALPMVVFLGAALIDKLGNYRWFQPYDREVFTAAIVISILLYIFFGDQIRDLAREEQEKLDREDELP
ncbi:MAG: hypothetical protein U1E93_04310 [Alphaproteobacteria bacterium]